MDFSPSSYGWSYISSGEELHVQVVYIKHSSQAFCVIILPLDENQRQDNHSVLNINSYLLERVFRYRKFFSCEVSERWVLWSYIKADARFLWFLPFWFTVFKFFVNPVQSFLLHCKCNPLVSSSALYYCFYSSVCAFAFFVVFSLIPSCKDIL